MIYFTFGENCGAEREGGAELNHDIGRAAGTGITAYSVPVILAIKINHHSDELEL